ncbi:MAG TPA: MarR family transcriptional regulator [Actinomycetes bacterium]|jgi:DNA-binding MarR family transcriptional regulator|nr:MarR family transcriptional regulator [Actinomycetes bacterium]
MVTRLGEGFRGPDGAVGYLLRQAQLTLRGALDEALRDLGITTPQYSVLSVLEVEPGLSGAQLARTSMLTPQTTNGILVALERAGHIVRTPATGDGRVLRARPTDAGRALLDEARERVAEVERRMTAPLTDQQAAQLRQWLVACARALHESP